MITHPAFNLLQQNHAEIAADPLLGLSMLASDYVANRVQADPSLRNLFCHDVLHKSLDEDEISNMAEEFFPPVALGLCKGELSDAYVRLVESDSEIEDDETLAKSLRLFRHTAMLRIIGRMACGIASCQQTILEISLLADYAVTFAARVSQLNMARQYGLAYDDSGNVMELMIIAMGKLGGHELNLSSDIDLIFVQPGHGETAHRKSESTSTDKENKKTLSATQFFTRAGKQVIALLNAITSDGFVFRVDMRLRPYGDSGALVCGLGELQTYYYEQARVWERFALTRARAICCGKGDDKKLSRMIEGFVYRRHIDFGIFDNLRELYASIRIMTQRQQAENNIKTGRGGIREIEFYTQALQLVYGGVYPQLRKHSTLEILSILTELQLVAPYISDQLVSNYLWLRDLENRIQALEDKQTQKIPEDPDKLARISAGMGFGEVEEFNNKLARIREEVHEQFNNLLHQGKDGEDKKTVKINEKLQQLSLDAFAKNAEGFINLLPDEDNLQKQIREFFANLDDCSDEAKKKLKALMPHIMNAIVTAPKQKLAKAAAYTFQLLENIIRRPVYLSLLLENPSAIPWLVTSLSTSDWCSGQIIERPLLLGCFVEGDFLWKRPNKAELLQQLQLQLFSLPENDLEQEMDTLRHFALSKKLQVALAQLGQNLSIMQVSDYLTYTAEVCIHQACHMAWKQLEEKHGAPGDDELEGLAVIAFGKLGGLEMSYTSDLDLVFVYDQDSEEMTTGARPVSYIQFYQRLAQRVIHLLSVPTSTGFAYEVDTRLRPNGEGGLLACSLQSWREYYEQKAWTWEYQALVRARPICGSRATIDNLAKTRKELLTRKRDHNKLVQDIAAMRKKMAETHGKKEVKHSHGGLVDIEFIVQYLALKHANDNPEIVTYPDNVRILQALSRVGVLEQQIAQQLKESYLALRNHLHYIYLGVNQSVIEPSDMKVGSQLWKQLFNQSLPKG